MLEQAHVIEQQSGGDVVVAGDGHYGKCAKFCTYAVMEFLSNIIIHSETVDKSRSTEQITQ